MPIPRALVSLLAPPLCAACGRLCGSRRTLCPGCGRRLAATGPVRGPGPQGVDAAWSSAVHEATARELVSALKFRRLLSAAGLMAERIAWLAPAGVLTGTLVPVPTARHRSAARGFDPAAELAAALSERTGLPLWSGLARRGWGRQRGRGRVERLGNPPRIEARAPAPRGVVLVDDVLTTGATVSACAKALRGAGSVRVVAVTFARRL